MQPLVWVKVSPVLVSQLEKDTAKSAAKSLGKVVLEEAASEAIEEGLTELLNPLAKGVTYKDFRRRNEKIW